MANDIKRFTAELRRVESNLDSLAAHFQRVMIGIPLPSRALAILRSIPGRPHYPIQFTSDRQRKAFFASDGFGRGIPTRRTGGIAAGWDINFIPTQDGGLFVLNNPSEAAKFVQGPQPFAQGFHIDTGWKQVEHVEEVFFNDMENAATQVFFNDLDPFEGVR